MIRKLSQFLLLAFAPMTVNAAGTYYSANTYQSPQTRYNTQTYLQRQTGYTSQYSNNYYSTPSYASRYNTTAANNYSANAQRSGMTASSATSSTANTSTSSKKSGFWIDAGVSHEFSQWQMEMNQSGSILSYDNVGWNVLGVDAGYSFDVGNTTMQIDAGLKYGMQWGESTMYDDDITNGGFLVTTWVNAEDNSEIGKQIGHAISIGTSQGGNMLGFNVGFGLTDIFKWGNVSITPSVGYRYLNYNLETETNYGLSVDTTACFEVNGEIQCDPAILVNIGSDKQQIIWRDDINSPMEIPSGSTSIDTGSTYYYYQPGVSHSYDVTWAGPYFALDMDYVINQNNAVNGRIELGLPGYNATGDQPYRFDWAHPKSVEDEAGMFGAFHFGLGANWTTAITDSVALSIGLTYDYYSVSGADAKTYLNQNYYTTLYNNILTGGVINGVNYGSGYESEAAMLDPDTGNATAINIKNLESECPGWVCSIGSEIESFYKSMGIRVGVNAKF